MNDHRIKSIVKSISNINSDNFFDEICISMSRAIDADFVFIAKLDNEHSKASSIAVANNGIVTDNFTYLLEYTPCAEVAGESVCAHSCDIQKLYPNDQLLSDMNINGYVGVPLKNEEGKVNAILVALFEEKVSNIYEVETLFLLFSGLIEKELHKSNFLEKIAFTNNIIESTHEGIMVCDKDRNITYVNPSFTRMTGYTKADLKNKTPKILSSGKQDTNFYQAMWAKINDVGHWQGEIWNKRKDGHEYLEWLSITAVHDEHQELTHYTAFFTDITEQHFVKEKVKHQRLHDTLTQLANKESLFSFIEHSIAQRSNRHDINHSAALLVLDVDLFKKFNSLYSHEFGDKVLIHLANKLKEVVRRSDIVARTSGDNFAVFANYLVGDNAIENIIENITQAFLDPFIIDNVSLKVTFSIGVAYFCQDAQDAHGLFEKAEQAMFAAKDKARNSYGFYSQQLSVKANLEEGLRRSLERAIENDEFSVVYQPIVSLKKKSVTKFEALVRWKNEGNWISPDEFIPVAEKFGLISSIGEIVLNKACIELKQLEDAGFKNIIFNVNRSIYEFPSDVSDFSWLETIKKHNLKPQNICFELTESVLAPENNSYIALLNQLQLEGCTIALDDFGTGYSSLNYLRRFPINTLKIDKSFISDMTKEDGDIVLVSAIISMAKALSIDVVAEGVEMSEEVQILSSLACDYIQGYYFSKPIQSGLLTQYLTDFQFQK